MHRFAAIAVTAGLVAVVTALTGAPAHADDDDALVVTEPYGSSIDLTDLAPGDSSRWGADVTNTASEAGILTVTFTAAGDDLLMTDPERGLQLRVATCAGGFAPDDSSCPAGATQLASGSGAALREEQVAVPLDGGASLGVLVYVSFPADADNAFENTAGRLTIDFSLVGGEGAGGGSSSGPAPGPGGLAVTGADGFGMLVGAIIAVGVGAVLRLIGSRRRANRGVR